MHDADSHCGGNGVLPTWMSSSKPGSRARDSKTEIDGAVWWHPTLDVLRAATKGGSLMGEKAGAVVNSYLPLMLCSICRAEARISSKVGGAPKIIAVVSV